MNCEDIQPQLTAYHLKELKPREMKVIRAHLDTCENCRAESEEIRATLSILGDALAVPTGSESSLTEERKAAVYASGTDSFWGRYGRPLQIAASVAILAGLGLLLLPGVDSSLQTASTKQTDHGSVADRFDLAKMEEAERTPFIDLRELPASGTIGEETWDLSLIHI